MFTKFTQTYRKFPKKFWVLVFSTFIDHLGGALMFPFFAIYITLHFQVGMTEVGFLFTFFGIGAAFGNFLGGALTDKFGRRKLLLLGLVTSGISSIFMGLINDINLFYAIAPIVGLLGRVGGPAGQAMVVDLLPKKTQPEGFAILRVVDNLAVTIGPVIGGLLASQSYMFLFIGDAVASGITALIVIMVIPESMPQQTEDEPVETVSQSFRGYWEVLKDWKFVMFVAITASVSLVYMQMNSTLSYFLFDQYDFSAKNFGFLLGMNAFMVVVFQFPVTRSISNKNPFSMIAIGTAFYAVGFVLYGFVSSVPMFFLAMIIITIGEIIIASFSQSLAASFATDDKRGRYMAIFGYGYIIPSLFGILLAGLIMDNLNPNWIWYIGGLIAIFAVFAYLLLLKLVNRKQERANPVLVDSLVNM